ncbi:hypothetical protein LTR59_002153 [Friedmanniomyces endolithicus]|nr:hypothetical protein LTR94_009863 [Friedmanniomyces endolithicus]KAK0790889.1 hypothetical protein LTR38_010411 [Friedmanniomyces endolithicus]KAK0810642.1 hypothetical protein LTR59_002153 [Friedmanniomyces endolithicus]KAK0854550.1 hypothetical protein LTR03_002281 [Friedmanniomyces endolithicus]KAK0884792.1 hypothetical protein LTR87_001522 [Friedmanniomyces endolithicus]
MDSYVDYSGQAYEENGEDMEDRSSMNRAHYGEQASVSAMGDAQHGYFNNANGQPSMACDIKPRLTKGQHEMLEAEYLKQNKPSTSTKKGFAEALGVSLDKVNNWFQNRRAKSKQDAKKAAGAYSIFHSQQQANQLNFSSDSDASPAYPAPDYFSMMQQCASDDRTSHSNCFSKPQRYPEHRQYHGPQYSDTSGDAEHPHDYDIHVQMPQDMFDSPQELNRRTLTQEQFDAFANNAGSMGASGSYDVFQSDFSMDQDVLSQVFPELQGGDAKQQHAYAYACPNNMPPPMSSLDSTIPSSASDQSLATFPSSSSIRGSGARSSTSSEWAGSRSSSVSEVYQEDTFPPSHPVSHPTATASQWKPGQSVPVDVNALSEQFRQVAQARHSSPQQYHTHEQPLAWPADNAYERRTSQTSSMLAQSMSHVGLHTPKPQQHAAFKSPAPLSNIAARRQRPRPAALGIASMRSQSYSGAAQPGTPGHVPLCQSPGQSQVRRIRSSNVLGGVAQGRIQKPMPGAPQRSPLAWSFSDAVNSPKGMRHVPTNSAGSLAPPTPLSPDEFPRYDQARTQPTWQSSGHVSRQPSISETDFEHGMMYAPAAEAIPQTFTSPPHTPRYHHQGFVQQRVGNNVITENTPPQSAPASQQSFPSNTLAHQYMQSHSQQPYGAPQHQQPFAPTQQPHIMTAGMHEQHFQTPSMQSLPQHQQMPPVSSTMNSLPLQYAHGIPMVNAQGQLELMVPSPFIPQRNHAPTPPQQPTHHTPPPPKADHFESMVGMFSTATPTPALQVTAQVPKQPSQRATELFVHEYSPPADMKRAATPRKPVETTPKNYSFANHGPEDFFRKGKKSRGAAAAASVNSPASSS